jgi:hypothetical protein
VFRGAVMQRAAEELPHVADAEVVSLPAVSSLKISLRHTSLLTAVHVAMADSNRMGSEAPNGRSLPGPEEAEKADPSLATLLGGESSTLFPAKSASCG